MPQQPAQSNPPAVPTPSIQTDTLAGILQVNRDLSISKTANSVIAQVGDTVIYNITVTNPTQFEALNTVITDVVDSRIDIISANATLGSVNRNGNVVTVQVPSIPGGQALTVTIIGRVNAQAVAGNAIDNTASLVGEGIDQRNSNTATVQLVPSQIPTTGERDNAAVTPYSILLGLALLAVLGYVMRWREVEPMAKG